MRNVGVTLAAALLGACSTGPYCDGEAAEAALAEAAAGEVVELGACELQGPLHVPPGVTLAGTEGTVVVAPVESGGIIALGGSGPTEIRDLSVRVEGRIGVLVRGGADAAVTDVEVDARRGIALGVAELASLEMTRVSLTGPVSSDNASESRWLRVASAPAPMDACPDPMDCECQPGELDEAAGEVCDATGHWATWTATFGLVLTDVAAATLTDVEVRGFAQWGAVFTDSDVTWVGGGVHDTLGIGIRQVGGALRLEDAAADTTHAGVRGERPYAVVATDGGRLEALRVEVSDNDRYGVLLSGATGLLEDVVAERNGDAALWLAETDDFELRGAGTRLADNAFAGAVVTASSGVRIADGSIDATVEQERPVGTIGLLRVGDGVHITDTRGSIELADLTFDANEHAGIAVDLGAMGSGDVVFTGVQVSGTGTQLGAIAGRPASPGQLTAEAPAGWDDGITRVGAVTDNDLAFGGTFNAVTEPLPGAVLGAGDALAVVAPMF